MERKFRVGDKVKVINNDVFLKVNVGDIGKIVYTGINSYDIKFNNGVIQTLFYSIADKYIKKNNQFYKLIFRDNATILIKDGKRYIAKCCEGDTYDKEKGLLVCLAKAHGYTFEDLQKMLKDAEVQDNKPNNAVKEVKRKAKVGEYIKVVDAQFSFGHYQNGDIFKVKSIHNDQSDTGVDVFELKKPYIYHEEYVVLENYKPTTKKFTDASRKVILQALEIIGGNGISFDTKDEVKEFYELVKGKFKIQNFNGSFRVGVKFFDCQDLDWGHGYGSTYTYEQLKNTIKKLLREQK